MKKLSILILCSATFLAFSSHPAKASPDLKKDNCVTVVSDVQPFVYEAPASISFVFVMDEANFVDPQVSPVEDVTTSPAQAATNVLPAKVILKEDPLAPDERIRLYRHYFNHEDNKTYPEYKPGDLSDGYTTEKYVPAR